MISTNSIFNIRPLTLLDISPDSGLFDAFRQLDEEHKIDYEKAKDLFNELKNDKNHYTFVAVMDSFSKYPIVGTATLRIEKQLLHNCSQYGVIDNVCVRKDFERMGIASALIFHINRLAREENCYKVILNCKDHVVGFYEKCGFYKAGNEMRTDIK